jgi:hypothetical protein
MKIFNNPKSAVVIIVLVILLFAAYKQASATEMELGATYASGFNNGAGLVLSERLAQGKMEVGIALIGEQDYDKENIRLANNGNVFASFVAPKPDTWWRILPSEVHIGAAGWIKTNRFIGAHLGYQLALKWRLTENVSINIRHWSNAGTVKPNRGQDLLTIGWRF